MSFFNPEYLDTNTDSIERIIEGRKHLNQSLNLICICFMSCFIVGMLSFSIIKLYLFGLFGILLSLIFLLFMFVIVIKREIYSVAIILRRNDK